MSARLFAGLEPWLIPYADYLVQACLGAGLRPRVTSVFRTRQDQERLWDRYRRGLSRLPAAPPGRSKHERGLAFDMVVEPREYTAAVGAFWRRMGGVWGGQRDPVHFEAPG